MSLDAVFDQPPPMYTVLFSTVEDVDAYLPIIEAPAPASATITVPHGFDREMADALPGMWYCLHLPNVFQQLVDIPIAILKTSQGLHLEHRILVVPIQVFDREHIGGWLAETSPVLVVCPDAIIMEADERSKALGFRLQAVPYSKLSNDSLKKHWKAIHAEFLPDTQYLGDEPALASRLDLAPTDMPRQWLARQIRGDTRSLVESNVDDLTGWSLWHQLVLAALADLEREGVTLEVAEQRMPSALVEERKRLRVPVALGLPGVPTTYINKAYDRSTRTRVQPLKAVDPTDTWSVQMHTRSDAHVERSAIELVTTHQALARTGVGLMLPTVPQPAFTMLAQLERHFAGIPNGPAVWRMLKKLDSITRPLWTEALASAVAHASMITAFTNFPIGLLRLPGDTSPLSTRVPIAYRPILPLTRAVQTELAAPQFGVDLSEQLSLLVAECIPSTDPVGRLSRMGWQFIEAATKRAGQAFALDVVETLSIGAFRRAIADRRPNVLILSAHGTFDPSGNVAGLLIGNEASIGPGLGPLPPVVVLSACSVAPRGAGAVSVTDLLLREGAMAVLGAQVPIDVRHNAMLMMRFLIYIAEVLAQREDHSTLLEIWHRVQTSNAINDILGGSRLLNSWGKSKAPSGSPVIFEFMNARSAGRLRLGRIYEDTERVLGEIADDQGRGERVRNWFRSPGYVPESLFYVFAGRPERIYLRPPLGKHSAARVRPRRG